MQLRLNNSNYFSDNPYPRAILYTVFGRNFSLGYSYPSGSLKSDMDSLKRFWWQIWCGNCITTSMFKAYIF
jgi:hypothetical protein